jgi:hypothetical protein
MAQIPEDVPGPGSPRGTLYSLNKGGKGRERGRGLQKRLEDGDAGTTPLQPTSGRGAVPRVAAGRTGQRP